LEETEILLDTYSKECIRLRKILDQNLYEKQEKIINIQEDT
jgi:hypothetical protein